TLPSSLSFFFTHPATTYISPLSLHDALPISVADDRLRRRLRLPQPAAGQLLRHRDAAGRLRPGDRQRRHGRRQPHGHRPVLRPADRKSTTSELQSLTNLVCRLLLEKKNHHTH